MQWASGRDTLYFAPGWASDAQLHSIAASDTDRIHAHASSCRRPHRRALQSISVVPPKLGLTALNLQLISQMPGH